MKKIFLFFVIFLWVVVAYSGGSLFAKKPVTSYYEQIKIVSKDRQEQKGSGQGQFITFTDKVCYDSDKAGFTVHNGFLKFARETADRVYYSGTSFWGDAIYVFTENYNRLNIVVESTGMTYVYALKNPPADITTSALIKEPAPANPANSTSPTPPNSLGGGAYSDVPIPFQNLQTLVNPFNGGGGAVQQQETRRQCPDCKGTGRSRTWKDFPPTFGGTVAKREWCEYCGDFGRLHTHKACPACKGLGYVRY